jgi:hypothetical protein
MEPSGIRAILLENIFGAFEAKKLGKLLHHKNFSICCFGIIPARKTVENGAK